MRLANLEEPSDEEWLLMRIAQRVCQVAQSFGDSKEPIRLEDQKIYPSEKGPAPELSIEEKTRLAKAQHGIHTKSKKS